MKEYPFTSFPKGWYCIGLSKDVKVNQVKTVHHFDRDLVLFRLSSGKLLVCDPYCPHLGAHLGDGEIVNDCLQCPFHHYLFDSTGKCISIPSNENPPKKAFLNLWKVHEFKGLIFVWYSFSKDEEAWSFPKIELGGWDGMITKEVELSCTNQDVIENGLDIRHFDVIHNIQSLEVKGEAVMDDKTFSVSYSGVKKILRFPVLISFNVEYYGLSFASFYQSPNNGLFESRAFILTTPIDEDKVLVRLISFGKNYRYRFLKPLSVLFNIISIYEIRKELVLDSPILNKKKYLDFPVLVKEDLLVAKFRRWAKSFYAK